MFCATQDHAAAIRDLINQYKDSADPKYCVRITANDGELGEQYLREFQDNEKTVPTILTTSQKLSTGVDARNIRNIILLRPVKTMIEFKQIIGRGTRLFEGKDYFTLYDFVGAYHHFNDKEWDGEPEEPVQKPEKPYEEPIDCSDGTEDTGGKDDPRAKKITRVKLRDGKEREIQHMIAILYYGPDGKPISAEEFLHNLFGTLPDFFKSEEELRALWSQPATRKELLSKLDDAGYGKDELSMMQKLIKAEHSDLFDVLEYVAFARKPITREKRVAGAQGRIFSSLEIRQKEFIEFVLNQYIETGVEELDQEKLPALLQLKYQSLADAEEKLGGVEKIIQAFIAFQKYLYERRVA